MAAEAHIRKHTKRKKNEKSVCNPWQRKKDAPKSGNRIFGIDSRSKISIQLCQIIRYDTPFPFVILFSLLPPQFLSRDPVLKKVGKSALLNLSPPPLPLPDWLYIMSASSPPSPSSIFSFSPSSQGVLLPFFFFLLLLLSLSLVHMKQHEEEAAMIKSLFFSLFLSSGEIRESLLRACVWVSLLLFFLLRSCIQILLPFRSKMHPSLFLKKVHSFPFFSLPPPLSIKVGNRAEKGGNHER